MTRKNLELNDISALDFTTQCARIADAYSNDTSSVDGGIFAYLAKRLIAAEVQPGGPYSNESGKPTILLNATIGRLFLLMGHPLPSVDAYLGANVSHLTKADREALIHYQTTRSAMLRKEQSKSQQHMSYRRAAKTLSTLDEPIKTQALQFLARIEKADTTREIAAISEFTAHALADVRISTAKLRMLGEANVHSWIAYSIYDHILDEEADTALLPAANICMRIAFTQYKQALPARHPMQALVTQYFDKVDATSAWEVASCRAIVADETITIDTLPDYQRYEMLAWRSCIHILGPLVVASFTPSLSGKDLDNLLSGLHHYLIARQLGDDIHDWREDLTAGRISAVVALLLARQNLPEHSVQSLEVLTLAIQKDFLNIGAVQISELILEHVQQALAELTEAGCDSSSELIGLVRRLERMANESIRHQQRFTNFQSEYTVAEST